METEIPQSNEENTNSKYIKEIFHILESGVDTIDGYKITMVKEICADSTILYINYKNKIAIVCGDFKGFPSKMIPKFIEIHENVDKTLYDNFIKASFLGNNEVDLNQIRLDFVCNCKGIEAKKLDKKRKDSKEHGYDKRAKDDRS